MSAFKHVSPSALILMLGLVLVAVLAPLSITKRQNLTQKFVCDRCGAKLWETTDKLAATSGGGRKQRGLEETELSRWFGLHINTNCTHNWRNIHASGRTYFALGGWRLYDISGGSGGQSTPPLTYLGSDDRARLEALLKESPTECGEFIHERLQLETLAK